MPAADGPGAHDNLPPLWLGMAPSKALVLRMDKRRIWVKVHRAMGAACQESIETGHCGTLLRHRLLKCAA
jgi:hypothetical protein